VQDVGRIDRQQRRGATEQHRKQVQRDRAQHRPALPDEAQTREQRVERLRLVGRPESPPLRSVNVMAVAAASSTATVA
jgi:hypothetical protein